MINRFVKKIVEQQRYLPKKTLLKRKKFDESNAVLIFSEARGGSTWLMECLKKIPGTCTNWEPMHPSKGVVPNDWGRRPFFNEKCPPAVDELLKDVISYRLHNPWCTQFSSVKEISKSEIVITKFVRANLLVPKYLNLVNFARPPILLLRHPIDVCRSQLQAFNEYQDKFELPDTLNKHIYEPHLEFLNSIDDALELKIALWCIHNCSVLNNIEKYKDRLIVTEYGMLAEKPFPCYRQIIQQLGFAKDADAIIEKMNFGKPSSSSNIGKNVANSQKAVVKSTELTFEKQRSIQCIFDYFELKMYDAFSTENHWIDKDMT